MTGIRGPLAHAHHTAVRLAFDQTLENATGAGAPPPTWLAQEQTVDIAPKAVYSLATGYSRIGGFPQLWPPAGEFLATKFPQWLGILLRR